ncbi:MAG: YbbR-like domain-containing protein [Acidobacteria bacterium]|nr:YbbR-like domain-containing protein [Acidobacteriota bacterium]MCW5948300.1 YbbR-like domain-containing protein [Pyrinomonadaceae bacterium]
MGRTFFVKQILKKVFLEDWALKLVALAITLALWFGVTGLSTPTTRRISVPLNLSISSNAQITGPILAEVEIEISGDKRRIEDIDRKQLTASVDLTEVKPGEQAVTLSPDTVYVPLPQGVKLTAVTPSRIAINLESVEEKELDVRADIHGLPAAGYEIYSVSVLPPKIRVRGPASVMRTLEFIQTARIDVTGKKDDLTARQITVTSSDPKAAIFDTVVDVVVRIGEKRVERNISAQVAGSPGRSIAVTLFGPRSELQKLRVEDVKAEPFLGDSGEESYRVILPAELLRSTEIRRARPLP